MVRTDQAFINEYLVYDEVFEACDVCERVCIEADYLMRKQARQDYLDIYFSEAMNFGKKKEPEKAENNIFAKIGKAIVNLIEKIKNFIKKIGDAIVGNEKKTAKANSAIQKIIADNPELKDKIVKGVKKEWFTIYDVAAYKNDVIGLINMLDQAKIDNQTALDKFAEATKKFTSGAASVIAGAGGILGIAKCMNEIGHSRNEVRKLSESMSHMAEVVKKNCEDAATKSGKDPKGFQTKLSTQTRIITGAFKVLVGIDKKYEDSWQSMHKVVNAASGTCTTSTSQQNAAATQTGSNKASNSGSAQQGSNTAQNSQNTSGSKTGTTT